MEPDQEASDQSPKADHNPRDGESGVPSRAIAGGLLRRPGSITRDVAAEVRAAINRLSAAGARTETLAEFHAPRRIGPFSRSARFRAIAPVWRLGVLLLAPDGRLFATGAVTRARDPRHPNFTSVSGEERREVREAARRAGFSTGETVDYDAEPLPLDASLGTVGPLVVRDGALFVSWNGSRVPDSLTPFAGYLAERVELLMHPPEGA